MEWSARDQTDNREFITKKPKMLVSSTKDKNSTATLDEALILTGFGIYNIRNMLLSGVILLGMIFATLNLSYVIPVAQCDLQLTTAQKGWLAAIPFIAIIVTSHMWGWLADTQGRRPVMLVSMLASVIITVFVSFAPNLAVFAVLQFIACVFISGPSGVAYAYVGEFNSSGHRDRMVAFAASFVGIGTVCLPAVTWLVLSFDISTPIPFLDIVYSPWRLLVVFCLFPYFISFVLLYFSEESPKFLYCTGQEEACLEVLRTMYSVNNRAPKSDYPVKHLQMDYLTQSASETSLKSVLISMRDQTVPLFKMPLLPWTSLACFVQLGIFATANGFYVWFPTILNTIVSHEGVDSSICTIIEINNEQGVQEELCTNTNPLKYQLAIYVGLVFSSVYVIVAVVVDYIGKKTILIVVLAVSGICGMVCHVIPNTNAAVALFGIFQMSGACIGLLTAVVVGLFPTKLRAMAVCLSLMFGRVGSVMGSNVIGILLETTCGTSFYLFGGLLLVCALLCLTLPSETRPTSKSAKIIESEPTQCQTHEPA